MKSRYFILSALCTIASIGLSQAQTSEVVRKDSVKVWGECGMCKKKIEKAAVEAGATAASWNTETKVLQLSYKNDKTDMVKIQQAIAASGYDTKDFTADNEAYNKLHECCKYERKSPKQ